MVIRDPVLKGVSNMGDCGGAYYGRINAMVGHLGKVRWLVHLGVYHHDHLTPPAKVRFVPCSL